MGLEMCSASTTAIQAPMVRARPARSLEGFPQGAASAVKPDRCVVGRDTQVAGHLAERLSAHFYAANQFRMLCLQRRNNIIHTGADGREERLIHAGCR